MSRERLVQLADGVYVERDVLRIAERIAEYDENLRLKFLNPDSPYSLHDAPYALFEVCRDGIERIVFPIWELNEKVLEKLYAADTLKTDVYGNMEKHNAAVKREQNRRYAEEREAQKDLVSHIFASGKTEYTFRNEKGLMKVSEDKPVEVVKES